MNVFNALLRPFRALASHPLAYRTICQKLVSHFYSFRPLNLWAMSRWWSFSIIIKHLSQLSASTNHIHCKRIRFVYVCPQLLKQHYTPAEMSLLHRIHFGCSVCLHEWYAIAQHKPTYKCVENYCGKRDYIKNSIFGLSEKQNINNTKFREMKTQ